MLLTLARDLDCQRRRRCATGAEDFLDLGQTRAPRSPACSADGCWRHGRCYVLRRLALESGRPDLFRRVHNETMLQVDTVLVSFRSPGYRIRRIDLRSMCLRTTGLDKTVRLAPVLREREPDKKENIMPAKKATKTRNSRAAKSVKDLPTKAKQSQKVKGGFPMSQADNVIKTLGAALSTMASKG